VAASVAKALEKVPADRFTSAREFAEGLTNPAFTLSQASAAGATNVAASRFSRLAIPLAIGLVLALALAAWGWFRPAPPETVARYGLAFPPGQELFDSPNPSFALAPDGTWMVYDGPGGSGGQQLWAKRRDAWLAVPLAGSEHRGGSAPAISPDGMWIVFASGAELRRIPRDGGSAITVADSVSTIRGVAWLDDGSLIYRDVENRLRRVPGAGGEAEVIWAAPEGSEARPRLPTALPRSRGILFSLCLDAGCIQQAVQLLDLRSGESHDLIPDAAAAWYAPTGHVVFVRRDGGVFAAPFDLGSLRLTGPSVPVMEGVQVQAYSPDFTLSASGSVLFVAGASGTGVGTPAEAVWVTRDGRVTPVDSGWQFQVGGNSGWSLSPNGRRMTLTILTAGGNDIWVKELDHGPLSRLSA
jgi:serine/threonine-protein kinase